MTGYTTSPTPLSPASRTNRQQAGFTLLEIMVAMVVLTLIVTTAFGALRLGERSWESGLEHSSKTENLRTVSGVLQRLFSQILPLSWSENTETTLAFNGEQQHLRFIGPAPQHHGATGLFEYSLSLEQHQNSNRLMLYYRLHNPDINGFAVEGSDREEVVLVEELKSASFSYFGSPIAKDPAQWHTHWNSDAETFPMLVHVQIVSQARQDQWPDLLLTLHSVQDK